MFNDYLDTPSIFGFYGTITSLTDIKVYFRQNIMTETSIMIILAVKLNKFKTQYVKLNTATFFLLSRLLSILRLSSLFCSCLYAPVDAGHKLNVLCTFKTFRRRPGRLLNVLCTFNLRPVSTVVLFRLELSTF